MPNTAPVLNVALTLTLAAKSDFAVGSNPQSVTSADVNGDGKLDLITANANGNSVSVLLGNGVGGFAAKTDFAVGAYPQSVTGADVNGDGKLDLITANYDGNSVSVLLGNGAGGFAAKTDFAVGRSPSSTICADVNGDGKLDLIAANADRTVSVLLGNGVGGFAAKTDFAVGNTAVSVTSADVNGDGKLDLITANYNGNTVSVLLGNGDGTFAAKTDFAVGNVPHSVTSADVNGDGKLDLITANRDSNSVSVLLGNGDGTFAAKTDFAVGTSPDGVTSADVNGDGKLDLITANAGSNNVSVLLGNGTGGFAIKTDFAVSSGPVNVTSADANGDGRLDLITANSNDNTVSVLLNTGLSGTFIEDGAALALNGTGGVVDAELAALNAGLGNYSGAALTLARQGGANAQDVFSGSGNLAMIDGGNVTLSGTVIGTATNAGGTLAISFNANATQARVDAALQAIAYSNSSHTPPASVTLGWSFSDGAVGGALIGTGRSYVNITAVNDAPVITSNGGGNTATLSVAENTMTVTTIIATDADGDARTYSITGGADAAKFAINTSTGKLNFSDAPNFEAPGSAASSNSYAVIVGASDGHGGNTTQTLTVNVTDVDESSGGGGSGGSTGTATTASAPIHMRGSSGIDTVEFGAKCSCYTLAMKAPDWTLTSASGSVVTLTGIERLSFADTTVALDINGNAGEVYRLYQAAFNRTPDQGGLGDWIYGMDNGMSLLQVASGFVNSAEFRTVFGQNPSNADLVTGLYQNVLHRAPEQAGFDYWLNQLQSGQQTRAQVLAGFSESPENQAQVVGVIQQGIEYTQHAA